LSAKILTRNILDSFFRMAHRCSRGMLGNTGLHSEKIPVFAVVLSSNRVFEMSVVFEKDMVCGCASRH